MEQVFHIAYLLASLFVSIHYIFLLHKSGRTEQFTNTLLKRNLILSAQLEAATEWIGNHDCDEDEYEDEEYDFSDDDETDVGVINAHLSRTTKDIF